MHENVPVRFGRGRLDSLATKGLAAYLIARRKKGDSLGRTTPAVIVGWKTLAQIAHSGLAPRSPAAFLVGSVAMGGGAGWRLPRDLWRSSGPLARATTGGTSSCPT